MRNKAKLTVASIVAGIAVLVWLLYIFNVKHVQWTEDVALSDGSIITVTQQRRFIKVTYELFQSGWETRYNEITLPDGVSFESRDRIGLLHLERGAPPVQWVLIASPFYCEEFNKYGRPRPDYIQFEYANGHWTYRAVQPEFFGRRVNLNVNSARIVNEKHSHVTVENKTYWNSRSEGIGWRYLKILANSNQDSCARPYERNAKLAP